MTEATFRRNEDIEDALLAYISSALVEAQNTLTVKYPNSPWTTSLQLYSDTIEQRLLVIFREARELSYSIQHDFFSHRLVVTLASDPTVGGTGTRAFGLVRHLGDSEAYTVLLTAEAITVE